MACLHLRFENELEYWIIFILSRRMESKTRLNSVDLGRALTKIANSLLKHVSYNFVWALKNDKYWESVMNMYVLLWCRDSQRPKCFVEISNWISKVIYCKLFCNELLKNSDTGIEINNILTVYARCSSSEKKQITTLTEQAPIDRVTVNVLSYLGAIAGARNAGKKNQSLCSYFMENNSIVDFMFAHISFHI